MNLINTLDRKLSPRRAGDENLRSLTWLSPPRSRGAGGGERTFESAARLQAGWATVSRASCGQARVGGSARDVQASPHLGNASGRRRRGAIAVLVAVLMTIFIVAVVFTLDVAYIQLTRVKLRTSTDAAARAGVEALSRLQNIDAARQAAKDMATANHVDGAPLILADEEIVFGTATRLANGAWDFTPGGGQINSVRVVGRRTRDSESGSVGLFFARALGNEDFEATQTATAMNLDRDICLVVDRSSSMKLFLDETAPTMSTSDERFCNPPDPVNSRWAALEAAVQAFIIELESTHQTEYVGLVSYASLGNYCGEPNNESDIDQPISSNPSLTTAAMAAITARVFNGGTNISAGIEAGITALTDMTHARPFAAKTMVLFTDGHATEGTSPVSAAAHARNSNIVIHTVTFGDGANQTDMIEVADKTGGDHYHALDASTLQAIFRKIALTLPIAFSE